MIIKDIMTTNVMTVNENDTIERCANLMIKSNLSGLPVVNDEGDVLGIVTEGDLIRRRSNVQTPAYLELLGGIIYLDNPNSFLNDVKKAMGLSAKEIMTEDLVTIQQDQTVEDAANLLIQKQIKRLPVLNDHHDLVGILSRKDIMSHLF